MKNIRTPTIFVIAALLGIVLIVLWASYRQQLGVQACGKQFGIAPERYSLAWWTCPIEVNRYARKIGDIGRQDLIDVASSADGKRLWALTRTGGVVASIDSGETWKVLSKIGADAEFTSIAASDDGGNMWATAGLQRDHLGSGTTQFFTSHDGGVSWQELNSGLDNFPSHSHVRSMSFNRALKRLFLVGEGGTISYTQDNGNTWQQSYKVKNENNSGALKHVVFTADGQIGWAVGEHIVLNSTDGGSSWQRIENAEAKESCLDSSEKDYPVIYQRCNSVQTNKDGREVWITTDYSKILHSSDGGQSWEIKQVSIRLFAPEIFFSQEGKRGWLFDGESLESRGFFETSDGGLHWRLSPKTSDFHINKMLDIGPFVVAIGDDGTILKLNKESDEFKVKTSSVGLDIHEVHVNNQL